MTSLLDSYEQQYAVLTADFTAKIAKLTLAERSERKSLSQDLEKQLDEIQELLEQMDLEVREVDVNQRPKYRNRMDSYRTEMKRLEEEFKLKSSNSWLDASGDQSDTTFGEISLKEEQKQRLLDTSEQIERTGNQLNSGYRILLETEDIGNQVLRDLHSQRETIQKSRARLRETDAELNRGSRILSSMIMRSIRQSVALVFIAVICIAIISFTIYYSVTKSS